jgi:hypothetical protein
LLSTGFAVISVHQRGVEITVIGVCDQFRKSDAQDFILGYFQPSPSTSSHGTLHGEPGQAGQARAGSVGTQSEPAVWTYAVVRFFPSESQANGEATYLRG